MKADILVDGMTCSSCASAIQKCLSGMEGYVEAKVNPLSGQVLLEFDSEVASLEAFTDAIDTIGFEVVESTLLKDKKATEEALEAPKELVLSLEIEGMSCSSCSSAIENALRIEPGVVEVNVNPSLGQGILRLIEGEGITPDMVVQTIYDLGFDGKITNIEELETNTKKKKKKEERGGMDEDMSSFKPYTITYHLYLYSQNDEEDDKEDGPKSLSAFKHEVEQFLSSLNLDDYSMSSNSKTKKDSKQSTTFSSSSSSSSSSGYPKINDKEEENEEDENPYLICSISFQSQQQNESIKPLGHRDVLEYFQKQHFHPSIVTPQSSSETLEARAKRDVQLSLRRLLVALVFALPLFLLSMVLSNTEWADTTLKVQITPGMTWMGLSMLLLATPVQFYSGLPFYKGAFKSFKTHVFGMDFLIATGTSAAYVYSLLSFALGFIKGIPSDGVHFFETSSTLIAVILLGKYMEALAKGKTSQALSSLANLKATSARLVVTQEEEEDDEEDEDEGEETKRKENKRKENKRRNGMEREYVIDSKLIQYGDVLRLVTGEKVPTDGVLLSGSVCVDEAMITGESVPVMKFPSEGSEQKVSSLSSLSSLSSTNEKKHKLVGGTMVVQGTGLMLVSSIGSDTTLGQIVSLVEQAQTSKPPIQAFADKVSAIFVPFVAISSLLTVLTWLTLTGTGIVPEEWYREKYHNGILFSFLFGLSVWVIACPCALGLATPTAVMVGTGVAAKLGIFIKTGVALQSSSMIDTVVFDKTGTLTTGKPVVTDFTRISSSSSSSFKRKTKQGQEENKEEERLSLEKLLLYLWNAESRSTHPLALAIRDYCEVNLQAMHVSLDSSLIQEDKYETVTGKGVTSYSSDEQHSIDIGSKSFMEEKGIQFTPSVQRYCDAIRLAGKVVLFVAINQQLEVIVGVSDAIRPEAAYTINRLKKMGIESWMLTGDHEATARAVGMALGIDPSHIVANCLPEDKAQYVKAIQEGRLTVQGTFLKEEEEDEDEEKGYGSINSIHPSQEDQSCCRTEEKKERKTFFSFFSGSHHASIVGFIGDGINDSPALTQADVGFAVGSGTEVAGESSDVILGKDSIFDVVKAIDLSSVVFNRIKLNYLWALGFNTISIPVAAGVFFPLTKVMLPPMVAGGVMAVSSVLVVVSSLALNWYTSPEGFEEYKARVTRKERKKERKQEGDSNVSSPYTEAMNLLDSNREKDMCECPVSTVVEIQEQSFFNDLTSMFFSRHHNHEGHKYKRSDGLSNSVGCGCGGENCKCVVECRCGSHQEAELDLI